MVKRVVAGVMLLGLLAVAGSPRRAAADYEERERRLKAIGVEPKLREQVNAAIDRAAAYLLRKQAAEGNWESGTRLIGERTGTVALCALALRHAGGSKADAGANRACAFLFDEKSTPQDTYAAGIAGMLVMVTSEYRTRAHDIAPFLTKSLRTPTSWWGYTPSEPGSPNLSTTQFGALGLWACERAGAKPSPGVWRMHLSEMIRQQTKHGSWWYWPNTKERGYPCGTFMGLANLILAQEAVAAAGGNGSKEAVEAAVGPRRKGMAALRRDGVRFLKDPAAPSELTQRVPGDPPEFRAAPFWPYYRLYALEKACIFAGVERLGEVPWYATGAAWLVRIQGTDGSWGDVGDGRLRTKPDLSKEGDLVSTALALLFLVRSSAVYRPAEPRPVDAPSPATTGK